MLGEDAQDGGGGGGGPAGGGGQGSGTGVTVTSLSAIRAERSRRKEGRRVARRAGASDGHGAALLERALGAMPLDAALQLAAGAQLDAQAEAQRPAGGLRAAAPRHALPEGTVREVFETHEVVSVPPPGDSDGARALVAARPRVQVGTLEAEVQRALGGVAALNPMQTAVHRCALYSSENFLVCAPTGAGKTNVALMAVCQQVLALTKARGGSASLDDLKASAAEGPAAPRATGAGCAAALPLPVLTPPTFRTPSLSPPWAGGVRGPDEGARSRGGRQALVRAAPARPARARADRRHAAF